MKHFSQYYSISKIPITPNEQITLLLRQSLQEAIDCVDHLAAFNFIDHITSVRNDLCKLIKGTCSVGCITL